MKILTSYYIKIIAIISFALSISCQEEKALEESSQMGYVEFSTPLLSGSDISNGRINTTASDQLSHIIISIQNLKGDSLIETKKIKLYNFNGFWISEQVSLSPGDYQITQFLVSDTTDNILYATPNKGSKFAYLVDEPLSLRFNVKANQVTKVIAEVISTAESQPEDFGYAAFSFKIVDTFDFLISVFIYNDTIDNYEFTDAHLSILSKGENLYDHSLVAETNRIIIKDKYDSCQLTVTKEGHITFKKSFTSQELKEYSESSNGPLNITLQPDVHLDSALIAYYPFQGNANDFGPHSYHGTVNGALLTTDKNNIETSAYIFDGQDDFIDMGHANLPIQDKVTVSAWVNTTSEYYGWVAGKYNWIEDKGFHLYVKDGYARFSGRDGNKEYVRMDLSTKRVADGKWHHILGICNQNIWQIWVDGTLAGELDSQHTQVDIKSSDPLTIGYYFQGDGKAQHQYFDGKIDNIRIYNRVLNENEIKKLYNGYL